MQEKSRIFEVSLCNTRELEVSTNIKPCIVSSLSLPFKRKDYNFRRPGGDVKYYRGSNKLNWSRRANSMICFALIELFVSLMWR